MSEEFLDAAKEIALETGKMLKEGFGTSFKVSSKEGKQNLVTEYDQKAEEKIFSYLKKRFPSHQMLGEESGGSRDSDGEVLWVVDPIDGTVNFAHTIPVFCVSIAAVRHGKSLAGVVYNPILGEFFSAARGKGSYLGEKKLAVSKTDSLDHAILATGFPYNVDEDPLKCIEYFSDLLRKGVPIRRLGSAALDLCYVAAGRFDAYWEVSLHPWDMAAGQLILEEAGGKVTDYAGNERNLFSEDPILSSNSALHQEMVATIAPYLNS